MSCSSEYPEVFHCHICRVPNPQRDSEIWWCIRVRRISLNAICRKTWCYLWVDSNQSDIVPLHKDILLADTIDFFLIGMVAEPIIYLVVWSTVARDQGGSVGGYTPRTLAAYYIVWTLVRNMNIVFTPYGWEWRIRRGVLSANLLRPVHPLHFDIAYFGVGKWW